MINNSDFEAYFRFLNKSKNKHNLAPMAAKAKIDLEIDKETFKISYKAKNNKTEIEIYDGNGCLLSRGASRCHPDDVFNYYIGIDLALAELADNFITKERVYNRNNNKFYHAAVGQVTSASDLFGDMVEVGDILRGVDSTFQNYLDIVVDIDEEGKPKTLSGNKYNSGGNFRIKNRLVSGRYVIYKKFDKVEQEDFKDFGFNVEFK